MQGENSKSTDWLMK